MLPDDGNDGDYLLDNEGDDGDYLLDNEGDDGDYLLEMKVMMMMMTLPCDVED